MSNLKDELEGRIFDILTPEFFIAALQSGQGPEPDETLGEWVVRTYKDAAKAVNNIPISMKSEELDEFEEVIRKSINLSVSSIFPSVDEIIKPS